MSRIGKYEFLLAPTGQSNLVYAKMMIEITEKINEEAPYFEQKLEEVEINFGRNEKFMEKFNEGKLKY